MTIKNVSQIRQDSLFVQFQLLFQLAFQLLLFCVAFDFLDEVFVDGIFVVEVVLDDDCCIWQFIDDVSNCRCFSQIHGKLNVDLLVLLRKFDDLEGLSEFGSIFFMSISFLLLPSNSNRISIYALPTKRIKYSIANPNGYFKCHLQHTLLSSL